ERGASCRTRPGGPSRLVHVPAEPNDELGQGIDVARGGVEVHDAGAEQVASADDGIGYECFAAPLHALEDVLVQRVQVQVTGIARRARAEVGRRVPERRDAEALRMRLEI